MIVGITGLISSGKDTAADYLCTFHGFKRMSFASALKDAVSAIFNWDRELLEGSTKASREWREEVDTWWATRLGIPHLTPRWVLQQWGTEVARKGFHNDIWVASVENRLLNLKDDIVITDCRFANELEATLGGVFSVLAQDLQLPLLKLLLNEIEPKALKVTTPAISTGINAISREKDFQNLNVMLQSLGQLGPEVVSQYLDIGKYISKVASALGMNPEDIVKSPEQIQMEQQQAMMMQQAQMQQEQANQMEQLAVKQGGQK